MTVTYGSFDIMMETKQGTTYNSYLINEPDGITIIDGVKAPFTEEVACQYSRTC